MAAADGHPGAGSQRWSPPSLPSMGSRSIPSPPSSPWTSIGRFGRRRTGHQSGLAAQSPPPPSPHRDHHGQAAARQLRPDQYIQEFTGFSPPALRDISMGIWGAVRRLSVGGCHRLLRLILPSLWRFWPSPPFMDRVGWVFGLFVRRSSFPVKSRRESTAGGVEANRLLGPVPASTRPRSPSPPF